jgi:hypothetical protein
MLRKLDGMATGGVVAVRRTCNLSVNPKSNAAATAPRGLHRPKMTAARAMKPLPDEMLALKAPEPPIVSVAPASPAIEAADYDVAIAYGSDSDADGVGRVGVLAEGSAA